MGGLGKTTVAKAVYNKVSTRFERCCFLENVRDTLSNKDGLVTLQNKIISDILRIDFIKAKNASDGIRIMRERVCKHKLLIVLDDVDERFQFEDVLGKLDSFSVDSRFFITARDARVLELLQECKLFELKEMSHDHSLKLFCKHAFGVDSPLEDYAELSEEFVQVAAGLPLALKVIGSLLFHTNKRFCEAKLIELQDIPPTKVQERLKISYNELTHSEKQIFLDVACLFIGANEEAPTYMWSDCDFHPASTIRTLVQRSLLRINEDKQFWMHEHVRDLGRAIVREENNQNPYKRSRIWSNRDAIDMLENKEGSDCVEALRVDMRGEKFVLKNKHLKRLSRLRYLEVWNGKLSGNYDNVLPNLRWLRLHHCDSFPTSLNLKKVIILGLEDCSVRDGWGGWNNVKVSIKLKVVNLTRCTYLKKVPDLSNCGGLELLDFCGCRNMHGELDIGSFDNLRSLGVKKTQITKLKGEIGRLLNLQTVDVSHTSLIDIPVGISKLSSLEFLDLTSTYFTDMLPDGLKSLAISSYSLPDLPSSLNYLEILLQASAKLPNLANLIHLTELRLDEVDIREIPGFGDLKMLEYLVIRLAPKLDNLSGIENLVLLRKIYLRSCAVLRSLPSLATLTKLHLLDIYGCPLLPTIHGVGELWETLSHLYISDISGLRNVGAIRPLVNLETLTLTGLDLTNMLPASLSVFTKLWRLTVDSCFGHDESNHRMPIEHFPDLSSLKNLRDLKITCLPELIVVTGLSRLESLEFLEIQQCVSIRTLPDLSGLMKLKRLDVRGCTRLTEVAGLGGFRSLEDLLMSGCSSITELPNLSGLKNLIVLHLRNCSQLKEVNGLEKLECLQVFEAGKMLRAKYSLRSISRKVKQLVIRSVPGALSMNI